MSREYCGLVTLVNNELYCKTRNCPVADGLLDFNENLEALNALYTEHNSQDLTDFSKELEAEKLFLRLGCSLPIKEDIHKVNLSVSDKKRIVRRLFGGSVVFNRIRFEVVLRSFPNLKKISTPSKTHPYSLVVISGDGSVSGDRCAVSDHPGDYPFFECVHYVEFIVKNGYFDPNMLKLIK